MKPVLIPHCRISEPIEPFVQRESEVIESNVTTVRHTSVDSPVGYVHLQFDHRPWGTGPISEHKRSNVLGGGRNERMMHFPIAAIEFDNRPKGS